FPRRLVKFNKSLISAHLTKQSYENNIPYLSSHTCLTKYPVTIFLPNLTHPYNITHLSLTNFAKSFVLLSHRLANTSTNISLCDSNVPLALPRKSWRKYCKMLT
ncbi:hypothetical protein ACHAXS_002042, partial [Conticribra weissflogii]